jgi:hypothetical protein
MLRILSLGAGVQSSTLALMSARGELPVLDCAIFADTGAEPAAVYTYLEWLRGVLPFPVHVVSAGNLETEILASVAHQRGFIPVARKGIDARPPFFVLNEDGSRGIIRRQCTGDFKVVPIQKKIRELLGLKPRQHWPKVAVVEQWIGISRDEASRMKPSQLPAIQMRWPLIELGMTRHSCLLWLESHGYPTPPKSACTFCPYRSDAAWRHLRDTDPEGWNSALAVDRAIRSGLGNLTGTLYVHDSLMPLEEVDLSTDSERGQPNLFENECEGMCGV